jgi:hypothetical protein
MKLREKRVTQGVMMPEVIFIMNIFDNRKPSWLFYLAWIGLHAVGAVIAWYVTWAAISLIQNVIGSTIQVDGRTRIVEDFLFVYLLLPFMGLSTGIVQYTLLRRYLPRMAWWIAATVLGWMMPLVIGPVISPFLERGSGTFTIMLGMALIGVVVALPQWWLLRQRVGHASWWIAAAGLGWLLIGLLNQLTSDPAPVLSVIALLPTGAAAVACWLLLDWFPRHELRGA